MRLPCLYIYASFAGDFLCAMDHCVRMYCQIKTIKRSVTFLNLRALVVFHFLKHRLVFTLAFSLVFLNYSVCIAAGIQIFIILYHSLSMCWFFAIIIRCSCSSYECIWLEAKKWWILFRRKITFSLCFT